MYQWQSPCSERYHSSCFRCILATSLDYLVDNPPTFCSECVINLLKYINNWPVFQITGFHSEWRLLFWITVSAFRKSHGNSCILASNTSPHWLPGWCAGGPSVHSMLISCVCVSAGDWPQPGCGRAARWVLRGGQHAQHGQEDDAGGHECLPWHRRGHELRRGHEVRQHKSRITNFTTTLLTELIKWPPLTQH